MDDSAPHQGEYTMSKHAKEEKESLPAVQSGREVFISQPPEDIDLGHDLQEFGANYTAGQMAMPFLNILQAMSPQVTRGDSEYTSGAQPGQFFNTVTKQLYDGEKGLDMIFGNFKESYLEWKRPRKSGGFAGEYTALEGSRAKVAIDPNNDRVIQDGSPVGTPGNSLSLTHTRLAFILSDDFKGWTPAIVSMASTQLKVSSNFNANHRLLEWNNPQTGTKQKGPPLPLCVWHVKTKVMSNDSGSWFAWDITFKGFLHEMQEIDGWNLYREARDFVKSSRGQQAMQDAAVELAKTVTSEEIPF